MKLANFILILTGIFPLVAWGDDEPVRHRRFDFSYAASVNGIPQGANVRIWIPVAATGIHIRTFAPWGIPLTEAA